MAYGGRVSVVALMWQGSHGGGLQDSMNLREYVALGCPKGGRPRSVRQNSSFLRLSLGCDMSLDWLRLVGAFLMFGDFCCLGVGLVVDSLVGAGFRRRWGCGIIKEIIARKI